MLVVSSVQLHLSLTLLDSFEDASTMPKSPYLCPAKCVRPVYRFVCTSVYETNTPLSHAAELQTENTMSVSEVVQSAQMVEIIHTLELPVTHTHTHAP